MSKKVKVRKEFIMQAHEAACSEWKKNIEKELPELFPAIKFEVGKWYIGWSIFSGNKLLGL